MNLLQHGQTVLFQGDSITDSGRDRSNPYCMGQGYASMVGALFSAAHPEKEVHFLNRGIGGNRIGDLRQRWQPDCIDLRPDWISILIGINDCWRRYDSNNPTSVENFLSGYRALLNTTREALPEARLILLEPFVLPYPEDRETWREDLDPKIHAVREVAREFGAIYVPLDGLFAAASTRRPPAFWARDGVHPTAEGYALIARSWLQAVQG